MPRLFALLTLVVTLFGWTPSANAAFLVFTTPLSGPAEAPPNASPGIGFAQIDMDTVAHTMRVRVGFSGLVGLTTASHVHAPTAVPGVGTSGIATELPSFTGFPLGVAAGTYDHTFDTSLIPTWNATFLANNGGTALGAETGFITAMTQGRAYLNVHSPQFPNGEIRGQLIAQPKRLRKRRRFWH